MAGGNIGILTFHRCINYGSYWQARALLEGLQARGYGAELLDHHDDRVTSAEWRCAFQPTLPDRSLRTDFPSYARKARRFMAAFDTLPESPRFALDDAAVPARYDAVVVGSDEVWNLAHPWYGGKELFFGRGLNEARLLSYAASFGTYSCHWGISDVLAERLRQFDSLSVRDENSFWLVRGATGREPQMVLDPVLQWPGVSEADANPSDLPYLLIYGHGFPDWFLQQVRAAASDKALRIVSIGYRNPVADEQWLDAGPLEFAAAMGGAAAVATNFFHGSVFALRHGKPFAAVSTPYRHNKLRDLTNATGCEERLLIDEPAGGVIADLLSRPPGPTVEARIAALRRQSDEFLDHALA